MRLALVALLGTAILLGACGGGGGGSRPATGGGGTHTVPFDPDDAPQTPPPIDPGGGAPPFSYRILYEWYGFETTPQTLVARNEAEYKSITDRCNFDTGDWDSPPPGWTPPVDFETEIVVAVFAGTVTGRQTVRIEGISRVGDGANVRWVLYVPGPGWPPDTVPTQPYALAAMTRVEGAVTFTGRTEIVPAP